MSDLVGLYVKLAPAGVQSLDLPLLFQGRGVVVCSGTPVSLGNEEGLSVCPSLSILGLLEVPHGSTHYPLFRATVLAISPSRVVNPKAGTLASAPLTAGAYPFSTAHYHCTCHRLAPLSQSPPPHDGTS